MWPICPRRLWRSDGPGAAPRLATLAVLIATIGGVSGRVAARHAFPPVLRAADTAGVRLHWRPGTRLGHPPANRIVNANGSPRITNAAEYAAGLHEIGPLLDRWARDPRLGLDPNYVAALLTKESGGDTLAVSAVPALGIAQLTAAADTDLRVMVTAPALAWIRAEVSRWPRAAVIHDSSVTRATVDSLLARGVLTARTEYLFDPRTSARAAVLWLHVLDLKWTTDPWPGGYGTFARDALAHGGPLDESRLVDLVTVSYNIGYRAVHDLVARYGAAWTEHLDVLGPSGTEAADYLERVRAYARVFEAYGDSAAVH